MSASSRAEGAEVAAHDGRRDVGALLVGRSRDKLGPAVLGNGGVARAVAGVSDLFYALWSEARLAVDDLHDHERRKRADDGVQRRVSAPHKTYRMGPAGRA